MHLGVPSLTSFQNSNFFDLDSLAFTHSTKSTSIFSTCVKQSALPNVQRLGYHTASTLSGWGCKITIAWNSFAMVLLRFGLVVEEGSLDSDQSMHS
jgi:hypothetical protein